MKNPPFRLYPEEQHWWSFRDYGAVLEVTERLQAKTVLEFGPGWSTRALIEGGAVKIDSCEDNPDWFAVHAERLVPAFPDIVTLHPFAMVDPLVIPSLGDRKYDLALIDGPLGTEARPPVIEFALERCTAVLVPTEEHAYSNGTIRSAIVRLAEQFGRDVTWMETGPLSGGFALITTGQSRTTNHQPPIDPVTSGSEPTLTDIENLDPDDVENPDPQPENPEAGLPVIPREPVLPKRPRRSRRKKGDVV